MKTIFVSLLLLTSCASYSPMESAQEFILESYQIKEKASSQEGTIKVMGAVGCPQSFQIEGKMPLNEVIEAVGGISFLGDKNCIQVIRGNPLCPTIYRLSLDHITHLPQDSLLLIPGDTVYIPQIKILCLN